MSIPAGDRPPRAVGDVDGFQGDRDAFGGTTPSGVEHVGGDGRALRGGRGGRGGFVAAGHVRAEGAHAA